MSPASPSTLVEVTLATDELSLHFRAATRAVPAKRAQEAPADDEDDMVLPVALAQRKGMQSLLRAVELAPRDARSYHALGEKMRLAGAPSEVEAFYWGHAVDLDPRDATAVVRHANALKARAENLSNSSDAARHVAAQRRALTAYRRVLSFEHGARDPAAHANLGAILYKLGKHRECERSFSKAAALLPTLPTLPTPPKAGAAEGGIAAAPIVYSAEVVEAAAVDGAMVLQVLHGLDMCLLQQGKRRKAQRVQQLGVGLGVWRLPEQRPHTLREGLLACPWHRKAAYGQLVSSLEAAAPLIRAELGSLLRRRDAGDASERSRWYVDSEHIAARPSLWLRRRLACKFMQQADDVAAIDGAEPTPDTCAAVRAATAWYAGPQEGRVGYSFEGGLFSLLAPGSHIRAHTGPTNERIVVSLGLAGVDGASLRIGNLPPRAWTVGDAHVFDDSFEHEVVHMGASARAVLVLHFRHPMLMGTGCPVQLTASDPCG